MSTEHPTQTQVRKALRTVDQFHLAASKDPDPVTFMRQKLAEAEADYTRTGNSWALALVWALEESLNGPQAAAVIRQELAMLQAELDTPRHEGEPPLPNRALTERIESLKARLR